jgi:hypothetical protein
MKAEPISYAEEEDDFEEEGEGEEIEEKKSGRSKRRANRDENDDAASEFQPRSIEDIQFGAWYDKAPTLPPLTEREVKLENRKQERLRKKKARKGKLTTEELKATTEVQIAQLAGKLAQAKAAYDERAAEHFKASTAPASGPHLLVEEFSFGYRTHSPAWLADSSSLLRCAHRAEEGQQQVALHCAQVGYRCR